ncbi:MAG: two-component sensor histidine kinase [Micavibrio sp.]|nr:two-component sensor histidine kinase [Micavibrio sp.]|tara:strand:- start:497264 stop:498583 length:1320 start_codon:yes stop_codon:yes gene_type:complete
MNVIKRILPRSLFGRSLLIVLLPLILLQIILCAFFIDNHFQKMTNRYAEALAGEIAYVLAEQDRGEDFTKLRQDARDFHEMRVTRISDYTALESKHDTHGFWEGWAVDSLADILKIRIPNDFKIIFNSDEDHVSVGIDRGDEDLLISFPERRIFTSSSYIFLLWMIVSSLLLSMIALWFMRNQVRPIRKLAVAAERIGRGQDISAFKPSGAREVRQAANAFLVMKDRIQSQVEQRTAMLAGISHDLRTPLTRLKLSLNLLGAAEEVDEMKHDVQDMERMIQGYLEFVRGEGDESMQRVDLVAYLKEVCETFKIKPVDFQSSLKGTVYYSLRPLAMERALHNFLGNAARYGEIISVSLNKDESEGYHIVIEDDGEGIDEELYDDVFRPFFRVDQSRNSETGGVGLGMTIARDILIGHGGHITLGKSENLGGLLIDIYLPD